MVERIMIDPQSSDAAARRLESFAPFRALKIQVLELHEAWQSVRILLPLNEANRNPGGTMFGGCIASLADPIPALACHRSFPEYAVWTSELHVDFRRPGTSDLELRFELPMASIESIGRELALRDRSTPMFEFGLYDREEKLVVWVKNRVAIRPQGFCK
jgi:uncharacterized protein (TIGR00369 family)